MSAEKTVTPNDGTKDERTPSRFMKGIKEAAITGFGGFMVGAFVEVIATLSPASPSFLTQMALIGLVGGVAFGFLHGSGD